MKRGRGCTSEPECQEVLRWHFLAFKRLNILRIPPFTTGPSCPDSLPILPALRAPEPSLAED